jgi:O-antigen/teichoic acid export membrane protein
VFLFIAAHDIIVTLFTTRYLASVPIFVAWTLTIVPAAFAVDGVLRTYAQTRFLLIMNVLRFALVVVLIWPFMSMFGLVGAVLITMIATSFVKMLGIWRVGRVLEVSIGQLLPWRRLAGITLCAVVAAVPEFWIIHTLALPPLAVLACAAAAYGATYAVLSYGSLMSERPDLPWSLAPRRRATQES